MRTVYLLRHGAAEAGPPGGNDFDRALSPEGIRAAQQVGAHLARAPAPPTFALSSAARRAVQTLEVVRTSLALDEVRCERSLYLAASEQLCQSIGEADDRCAALLLVGHNPGIGQLAYSFVRPGTGKHSESLHRELLQQGYPAAALAVFAFDVDRWLDIGFERGRLLEFTPPAHLDAIR